MPFTINGTTGINLGTQPLTGSLPDANAPIGSILQVVSTNKTDTFSTNSTSFTSVTGLSASITPISASSRILIIVNMTCGPSVDSVFTTRIVRNSTAIGVGDAAGSRTQANTGGYSSGGTGTQFMMLPQNICFLDNPSTTSAITYAVQLRAEQSGLTVFVNRDGNDADNASRARLSSSITVMEIAA